MLAPKLNFVLITSRITCTGQKAYFNKEQKAPLSMDSRL